jgi:xanthine dehydrogenase YagR molybdenum-binding subunit
MSAPVKRGAVGQPVSRVDGAAKVKGAATFTAEYGIENLAHAVLVPARIARGRIIRIETAASAREPGVVAVVTRHNAPKMRETEVFSATATEPAVDASSIPPLGTDEIFYYGQPVAVVVAATREQAASAATLVTVEYETREAKTSFDAAKRTAAVPSNVLGEPAEISKGDAERALAAAPRKVDEIYRTPRFNHNAIEPHATVAEWSADGRRLTVYDATQYITGTHRMLAKKFDLDPANVHVVATFVGGGFGGKGSAWPHVAIAAAAAKVARRPVKLVLSREETHLIVGGRTPSEQRVALGASEDGVLTALIHTGVTVTTPHNDFPEQFTFPARHLWASEHLRVGQTVAHLDVVPNTFMRAPGESIGTFALESALDELAHALHMDPIALRLRNEPSRDPTTGAPYSMRSLPEAFRVGAEKFGWARRKMEPRITRHGRHLVGYGVATAYYPAYQFPAAARVEVRADGSVIGQSGAHEMGMGTATAQAQILADQFGVPLDRVRFEHGHSRLPVAPVAGGSNTTVSVSAAVTAASDAVKRKIHEQVVEDARSPLFGATFDEVTFQDGRIARREDPAKGEAFGAILQRFGRAMFDAQADAARSEEKEKGFSYGSYGAQFSEVRIDEDTGEVRVTRFLGVFDCGRIINPKTASSQFRGGIVMGIGMALTEESLFDERLGRIVNPSLAEYHVPVHLDVPNVEVHFLDVPDPHTPHGARGIGEIGITGVAASIANAVFNATGRRIRELPITLDKLL